MPPITIPAKDNFDKSKKYPAIFSFRTSFFFLTSSFAFLVSSKFPIIRYSILHCVKLMKILVIRKLIRIEIEF